MSERYVLDTCALIWMSRDEDVSPAVEAAITDLPTDSDALGVSVMTAWEIGMLTSKGRLNTTREPLRWFYDFLDAASLRLIDVTPEILIASSYLPLPMHGDPADRIIIATAREHDLTIITRDRAILAYGAAGHVKTLAC